MAELKLSPAGRRYGYLKDQPDERDLRYSDVPFPSFTSGDSSRSLIGLLGAVLDQGQQGSCTAHAEVENREFLHWKTLSEKGLAIAPPPDGLYSPSFAYYMARFIDGSLDQGDCGSTGRTICQVSSTYGLCFRSEMPYSDSDYTTAPTQQQMTDALEWKSGGYHRLGSVDEMKSCISSGYCFKIGFTVYDSFETSIGSDGIWSPDKTKESILGGHEVLAVGFDDTINGGSFEVRNSWGPSFGKDGNFYLRYSDAADPDILIDAWIQHLGVWAKPGSTTITIPELPGVEPVVEPVEPTKPAELTSGTKMEPTKPAEPTNPGHSGTELILESLKKRTKKK
jgi:hypothetical protein